MGEALLQADAIRRVLGRGEVTQEVLHGVSLRVDRGEFVALTGASGSGKSTLLYILGALDRPDGGSVRFEGSDLTTMSDEARADFRGRRLGYVFQFHFLLPELTAEENVALPLLRQDGDADDAYARAARVLATVGLEALGGRYPNQLSGGQQQRVAIARAMVHSPALILADEPTGALDSKNASAVFAALRYLSGTFGTAVVMVTHDANLAGACDRWITLSDGRIVADDTNCVPLAERRPPPSSLSLAAADADLATSGEHLSAMLLLADEADAEAGSKEEPE